MMKSPLFRYKAIVTYVVVLIASILYGCGGSEKAAEINRYAGLTDNQIVEKRIQERWDAAFAGDYEKVYEFATPQYRSTYDLKHFSNQYSSQVNRTRITIHEVTIAKDDPTTARAVVLLYFLIDGWGGEMHESYSRVEETWVKRDGMWWFVEKK